jgi:hypothetical protein
LRRARKKRLRMNHVQAFPFRGVCRASRLVVVVVLRALAQLVQLRLYDRRVLGIGPVA